jgi:hypothetical protein
MHERTPMYWVLLKVYLDYFRGPTSASTRFIYWNPLQRYRQPLSKIANHMSPQLVHTQFTHTPWHPQRTVPHTFEAHPLHCEVSVSVLFWSNLVKIMIAFPLAGFCSANFLKVANEKLPWRPPEHEHWPPFIVRCVSSNCALNTSWILSNGRRFRRQWAFMLWSHADRWRWVQTPDAFLADDKIFDNNPLLITIWSTTNIFRITLSF